MLLNGLGDSGRTFMFYVIRLFVLALPLKSRHVGANSSGECHSSGKSYDVQQNAPHGLGPVAFRRNAYGIVGGLFV